jgi:hypothetical protein
MMGDLSDDLKAKLHEIFISSCLPPLIESEPRRYVAAERGKGWAVWDMIESRFLDDAEIEAIPMDVIKAPAR